MKTRTNSDRRLVAVDTPLAKIKPYPNNPRSNDGAVKFVAASIKAFGWRRPILVDEDGVILAGHTRLKAAYRLGLASAPVCTVRGLTDAQKTAFRIRDNRAGELSLFDWDMAGAYAAKALRALRDRDYADARHYLIEAAHRRPEVAAALRIVDMAERGSIKSEAKSASSRINGRLGGRPRKCPESVKIVQELSKL